MSIRSLATGPVDDVDRAAVLGELAERIRPTVLAAERTLAAPPPLRPLFPAGGPARGSVLAVEGRGATSTTLALVAAVTGTGSWAALVGVEAVGWSAAVRAGVALRRTVSIDAPPTSRWATVVAALVETVDVVVVDPRHQVSPADARRLAARCRERGAVLVRLVVPDGRPRYRWPTSADLTLACDATWSGLGEGSGVVDGARLRVRADGRRTAPGAREVEVRLDAAGRLVGDEVPTSGGRGHLRRVV